MLGEDLLAFPRGYLSKAGRGNFDLQPFSQLCIGLYEPGVENRNLLVFGKHFLRYHDFSENLNLTGFRVERTARLTDRPHDFLGGS